MPYLLYCHFLNKKKNGLFKENSYQIKAQFLLLFHQFSSLKTVILVFVRERIAVSQRAEKMRRVPPKYHNFFEASLYLAFTKWSINISLMKAHKKLNE